MHTKVCLLCFSRRLEVIGYRRFRIAYIASGYCTSTLSVEKLLNNPVFLCPLLVTPNSYAEPHSLTHHIVTIEESMPIVPMLYTQRVERRRQHRAQNAVPPESDPSRILYLVLVGVYVVCPQRMVICLAIAPPLPMPPSRDAAAVMPALRSNTFQNFKLSSAASILC